MLLDDFFKSNEDVSDDVDDDVDLAIPVPVVLNLCSRFFFFCLRRLLVDIDVPGAPPPVSLVIVVVELELEPPLPLWCSFLFSLITPNELDDDEAPLEVLAF